VFRRRLIVTIVVTVFIQVFVYSLAVHYLLGDWLKPAPVTGP
jgi:hypothetical protein